MEANTLLPNQVNTTILKTDNCGSCGKEIIKYSQYCDKCWVIEKARREQECKEELRDKRLELIPEYYRKMTFENFTKTDKNLTAYNAVQSFITDTGKGLFLYGTCGAGKTHLAAAARQAIINDFKQVRYIESPELMMKLRKSFDNKEVTDEKIINFYVEPEYLIIDDFGADRTSAFAEDCFYLLLNRRLTTMKHKILMTSNKSLKDYALSTSDRIASRIAEMCQVVSLNDYDHRLKVGKNVKTPNQ